MSERPILERHDTKSGAVFHFWCPGCETHHGFNDTWKFDGDYERPTVSPSLLSTFGTSPGRCHLFIRNGQLQFLGDCTHALAGKTVPMEPLP